MRIKIFFKALIITSFLTLPVVAQDSVDVTFRYYPENTVTRVMLPGEFNDFGPNNMGVISPSAPSLMEYDFAGQFWFKTIRLEVGGGESTNSGNTGYRYKFHEHYDGSGSNNAWIADPLNPNVAVEGFGDSWVEITHPLIFQMQPRNNEVFQLDEPDLIATVAGKTTDPISEVNSKIYVNGVEADNFEGYYNSTLQILNISSIADLGIELQEGSNTIKIMAVSENGDTISDSTQFAFIGQPQSLLESRPAGLRDGITYSEDGTSVTVSLFAPKKEYAFVIGDFNDWAVDLEYQMKKDSINVDSVYFWYEITGLTPDQEYGFQYLIDGEIRIADPYSQLVLDEFNDPFIPESVFPNLKEYPEGKTSQYVTVLTPGKEEYVWEAPDFERPDNDELMIYELLLRDFIADHSYQTLLDTLDYLSNLGINAIELMPVNEFDGNESWGYNPSLHYALDKYYGTPESFKDFVDECHKRGIVVLLDVVLNHASGQNPLVRLYNSGGTSGPTADNPYFFTEGQHPANVFNDMNHYYPGTEYYSKRVMEEWLTEYNVDGFRFDLSKGFIGPNTNWDAYNPARIALWKRYADHIWSIDPGAYVILEHFGGDQEENELSEYGKGMMFWGGAGINHNYNEATMGYHEGGKSNLNIVMPQFNGFSRNHMIGYFESHDEQWLMFKNRSFGNSSGGYSTRTLSTALDRMELAGAFFFTLPGPKMIWQFVELGYGYGDAGEECLKPGDGGNGDCPSAAPGRTGNKPIRWDYYSDPDRKDLYNAYSEMMKLRYESPVFTRPEGSFYALSGAVKYFRLTHSDTDVVVIGNFGVTATNQDVDFTKDGIWYDYFGASTIDVSNQSSNMDLAPGEFKIFTTKQFNFSTSTDDITGNDGPREFKLYQNYPNPFNPTTTINYDVAQSGLVTIEIYDIVGRKVAELVNGVKAAGTYSVQFDASNLSSGVYFARLQAGNNVQMQKMTLLK